MPEEFHQRSKIYDLLTDISHQPLMLLLLLLTLYIVLTWINNLITWRYAKVRRANNATLFNGSELSAMDFYDNLTSRLINLDIKGISFDRVTLPDGGAFSSSHEAIRISRAPYYYDVYVAGFSNGIFVSWWFVERLSVLKGILASIPRIGVLWRIPPVLPYYEIDTASAFRTLVEEAVHDVTSEMIETKGVRTLSPYAPK